MALKVAGRGLVPPFIVMDVMQAAARRQEEGGDVLHLEVGQPATGLPARALAAAQAALAKDRLGYSLALGIDGLREKIARHYRDQYGVGVDSRRIAVTTGSSGAFLLAFLSAFEAGDRVGVAAPGYPAYRNILSALGIEPVLLPVGPESRFQPGIALLEGLAPPLDGLIVASPSNPTGSMLPPDEFLALADWCGQKGVRLVSDEIYHGLTYDMKAVTAADRHGAIVVNSFSKYYAMTGWRLGWLVLPDELVRPVECLAQNLFIAPPSLSQHAAIAALDCREELDANLARYAKNRAILQDGLISAGFEKLAPADGAFYLYADVAAMTDDSEAFCRSMLAETGIAATPGVDFDPLQGRHFVRFCFSGATADMQEAVKRLKAWKR